MRRPLGTYLARPSGHDSFSNETLLKNVLLNLCGRSEEHTSELQSQSNLVCRLLLEKKKPWGKRSRFRGRVAATRRQRGNDLAPPFHPAANPRTLRHARCASWTIAKRRRCQLLHRC